MSRWWWYRPFRWSGLLPSRGSDEYGRHTIAIPTVIAGTFVIVTKACDCHDMAEFRCINDGCPWIAMTTESECLMCDPPIEEAA